MSDQSAPQSTENDLPEGLIRPEDIRSTSRSCLAILLISAFIVLMLCVFIVVQTWVR